MLTKFDNQDQIDADEITRRIEELEEFEGELELLRSIVDDFDLDGKNSGAILVREDAIIEFLKENGKLGDIPAWVVINEDETTAAVKDHDSVSLATLNGDTYYVIDIDELE